MQDEGVGHEEQLLLEQLRHELIAPERRRIASLEEELADPERVASRVAEVLPRAVKTRAEADKQLAWALQPTLEAAIRETVRVRREEFAEAIYPVIGPSITRAIRTAIAEMLQRLNQVLATRFSIRSVRWRIQAARTGRPFAEVVFLQTLVYHVEQVLLVDRDSGLLLHHVASPEPHVEDPAVISALLAALNSFSREAFHAKQGIERLEVGDLSVWVASGARAMLAAVVRGNPPVELGAALRDTLHRVQLELAEAFDEFRGDTAPFERAGPLLESCLKHEHRAAAPSRAKWIGVGFVGALVLAIAVAIGLDVRSRRLFERGLAALASEPGLVVTSAERRWGADLYAGLRDRLARPPEEVLSEEGIDSRRYTLRFGAFQSLDPPIVEARLRELLNPPPEVTLSFREGTVFLEGRAESEWIFQARTLVKAVDPSIRVSTDGLFTRESAAESAAAARRLSRRSLRFEQGSAALPPMTAPSWREVEASIRGFLEAADRAGMDAVVEIQGGAGPTREPDHDRALAAERAESVQQALIDRGLPAQRLRLSDRRIQGPQVRFAGVLGERPRGSAR